MRRPEPPEIDRYIEKLDRRLRDEVVSQRRFIVPSVITFVTRRLRALTKPLIQSGAMALTGMAVIIAISATPAATSGDLAIPIAAPLGAPDPAAIIESDSRFIDYLPQDDIVAVQEADNSDIAVAELE